MRPPCSSSLAVGAALRAVGTNVIGQRMAADRPARWAGRRAGDKTDTATFFLDLSDDHAQALSGDERRTLLLGYW
jgi:hypothetical protein